MGKLASNIFLGLRTAVGLGVLAFAAWTFWPVGSVKFDWREVAHDLVQDGDCVRAGEFLGLVRLTDVEGVAAFEGALVFRDLCSAGDDTDEFAALAERIDAASERLSTLSASVNATLFWHDARGIRSREGRGLIAFPEFIIQFRCLDPLLASDRARYAIVRQQAADRGFSVDPPNAAKRRAEWCIGYMQHQARYLTRHEGRASPSALLVLYQHQLDALLSFYQPVP